jgi:hypothetical protein
MDFKYVTDMNHLFSEDPNSEMPDELLEFRTYLGHIIGSATVTNEVEFLSAILCRKKVNRKPCEGFVKVTKQNIPDDFIYWHCSSCDDGGRLAHWRGCCFDQSQFPQHSDQDDEPNPPVEVEIIREEMKALLSGALYDPDSERIIYSARPVIRGIVLRGLYGDMDNFVGFIASDANHEEDKKRRKLMDSVYKKVESATHQAYEDAGMGIS